MKPRPSRNSMLACVLTLGLALSPPAFAEKPDWAGGGKHEKKGKHERDDDRDRDHEHHGERDGRGGDVNVTIRFGSREREIIRDYYRSQARAGKCPPGLAKKNNGCLPPGQAKKWARGRPLGDVDFRDLPYDLRVRLPAPPAGHRYVEVAGDVLMIAIGTSLVVDALEDLMR